MSNIPKILHTSDLHLNEDKPETIDARAYIDYAQIPSSYILLAQALPRHP